MGAGGEEVGVLVGWIDVGVLSGEWTRESGGGKVWTDELVYLVSVGVECVCVKGSLVLDLVMDWTQCIPQGVGVPPAMLRGEGWLPKKTGWPGLRRGGVGGYNLHSPPEDKKTKPLWLVLESEAFCSAFMAVVKGWEVPDDIILDVECLCALCMGRTILLVLMRQGTTFFD